MPLQLDADDAPCRGKLRHNLSRRLNGHEAARKQYQWLSTPIYLVVDVQTVDLSIPFLPVVVGVHGFLLCLGCDVILLVSTLYYSVGWLQIWKWWGAYTGSQQGLWFVLALLTEKKLQKWFKALRTSLLAVSVALRSRNPVECLVRDAMLSEKEAQLGGMFLHVAHVVEL